MKLLSALCLLVLLPVVLFAQAQYAFEGEELNFTLLRSASSDSLIWSVCGDFYMSNLHNESLSRMIVFPVPSTLEIGGAENIKLELMDPSDSMAVDLIGHGDNGFSFRLDLPSRSFVKLRISYNQRIGGNTAHYVLLTANSWGRPLPFCDMTLTLGHGIELEELPFPSPSLSSCEMGKVYHWQYLDFRPDKDFIVMIR